MFLNAGCSLRAEGFSCSLVVLHGGLGISKLQFFLPFLIIQTLDPEADAVRIRIRIDLKCWIRKLMRIRNAGLLRPAFEFLLRYPGSICVSCTQSRTSSSGPGVRRWPPGPDPGWTSPPSSHLASSYPRYPLLLLPPPGVTIGGYYHIGMTRIPESHTRVQILGSLL
jgi:hypothetical protein